MTTADTLDRQKPLLLSIALWAGSLIVVSFGSVLLSAIFPTLPGYSTSQISQSLILVMAVAVLLVAVLTGCRWWTPSGFTSLREIKRWHVVVVPALLLAVPFVRGLRPIDSAALIMLAAGYLATAFFEEGLYRGIVLGLLRPRGLWFSVRCPPSYSDSRT